MRRLTLGGWHVNHLVMLVDPAGRRRSVVLRRWARRGWDVKDPDFDARREVATYQFLMASNVPAPQLIAADIQGRECDVPAILLTRLPGHPPSRRPDDIPGFLRRLAEPLPMLHTIRPAGTLPAFRPWHDFQQMRPPGWAVDRPNWHRLIDYVVSRPLPAGPRVLIHRDYHPENTLWRRGRLTGIVDWTSASYGPPAVDLATMRANLVGPLGLAAADEFASIHASLAGAACPDQAHWDAVVLADLFGENSPSPPQMTFDAISQVEDYLRAILSRLR